MKPKSNAREIGDIIADAARIAYSALTDAERINLCALIELGNKPDEAAAKMGDTPNILLAAHWAYYIHNLQKIAKWI